MRATIDLYLTALPEDQRAALEHLRATIAPAVADADEAIRTRVPAVSYKGKTAVGFGAARHHMSLYVMRGSALTDLRANLEDFDTSNTVVRFTPEKLLPAARPPKPDDEMNCPRSTTAALLTLPAPPRLHAGARTGPASPPSAC